MSLGQNRSDMAASSGKMLDADNVEYDATAALKALVLAQGVLSGLSIDAVTGALNVLRYEHHEIHDGRHFFVADFETEAMGGEIEFIVTQPDITRHAHMTWKVIGSQITSLEVYRGPTGINGGTPVVPANSNDNSANASGLTIVKDPVAIAADGDRIYGQSVGANRVVGIIDRAHELVLRQNTSYLFRMTSGGNGNIISFQGEWYEHVDASV